MSWVRHRDVHILTAGEQTFTSDQRFSSKHNTEDQWVLLIKYVQVCCQTTCLLAGITNLPITNCRRETLASTSVRFPPSHPSHIPSLSTLLVMINISVSKSSILRHCSVPHVGIHGSPDLHVNRGSTINLTCVISHTPEPPAYIFWYFNDNVMAYDSPR